METHPNVVPLATTVVHKPRSFLSNLVLGISALVIMGTLCTTAVILYGMNIADRKADDFVGFAGEAVKGLPELKKALPPVLADIFNDRRRPEYHSQISILAKLVPTPNPRGGFQTVIELENKGSEVVTLLSLNVVILDRDGVPLSDWIDWGATPLAVEDEWRGPLMPGAKRRFTSRGMRYFRPELRVEDLRAEAEISDIRIWKEENKPARVEREV